MGASILERAPLRRAGRVWLRTGEKLLRIFTGPLLTAEKPRFPRIFTRPLLTAQKPGFRRIFTGALLLSGVALGCEPGVIDPGEKEVGPLRIHPVLESEVDPVLLGLDGIQVTITEADGNAVVADTLLDFDAGADAVLAWLLELDSFPTTLLVHTEVRSGSTPMFAGVSEVEVFALSAGSADTRDVPLPFIGPGHDAAAIEILPGDSLVSFGHTLRYRAQGVTADGELIRDPVVVWSSSAPDSAPIDEEGQFQAPSARSGLTIRARTPRGITDSTGVRVQPAADVLDIVTGHATSAVVAAGVPLAVRVIGADGEGVEGVEVFFKAPEGGAVDEASVLSDPEGLAEVEGMLGTVAGPYDFTVNADGVTPVKLVVTAEAGPPVRLAFDVQPSSTEVGEPFSEDVTVELLDEYGNRSDTDSEVRLVLGENPSEAALSGSTVAAALGGLATYEGLSVSRGGSGYTLLAGTDALESVESERFDVAQRPRAIEVSPEESTLAALEASASFVAVAFDAAGEPIVDQAFEWSTSDPDVAVVDAAGVVTAVGNGAAEITATAETSSATVEVVVEQQAAIVEVSPVGTTFSSLQDDVQLEAVARDANEHLIPDHPLVWGSSADDVASVDASGLVTALANGTSTVTAEAASGTAGSAAITVQQQAATVRVTPGAGTLGAIGEQAQLTGEALDANGHEVADAEFAWTSGDPDIAQVDPEGLVTATGGGETDVRASVGSASGSAAVTVNPTVASLTVTPDGGTLDALDATLQLEATALDANGHPVSGASVTWTSGAPSVASVDSSGRVTAIGNGEAAVTAESGGVETEVPLTVAQAASTIQVEPASAALAALEETVTLDATVLDSNGHPLLDQSVEWSSSDPEVLSMDGAVGTARSNGSALATAIRGDASGSATITVDQEVISLTVSPESGTLVALEATLQLEARALDANGHPVGSAAVTWTSGTPTVAAVDDAGLVTAAGNGEIVVTAEADGVGAGSTVTVEQAASTIEITPDTSTLTAFDETVALDAVVLDANGHPLGDQGVSWTTSSGAVASVDSEGVVTARANGDASITAERSGITRSAAVTVQQQAATVRVTPATVSLGSIGAQTQLTAEALDANGHPVADASFDWTSGDAGVAQVDQDGVVTAAGSGETEVAAAAGSASGSAAVTVSPTAAFATITAAPREVEADGEAASTITVQVYDAGEVPLTQGGDRVTLGSTVGELSDVIDNDNGTYTAELRSSDEGTAVVTGTLNDAVIDDSDRVEFTPVPSPAAFATITAAPREVEADGEAASTITVQVYDADEAPLTQGGDRVTLESTLGELTDVVDNDNGTYTAGLRSSDEGTAVVTGTLNDAAIDDFDRVEFTAVPSAAAFATIESDPAYPTEVEADGDGASTITVRVYDAEKNPLSGASVTMESTLGTLTPVVDHGDGTYTAELRSTEDGKATVTGTVDGEVIDGSAHVLFETSTR